MAVDCLRRLVQGLCGYHAGFRQDVTEFPYEVLVDRQMIGSC
ncbi:hypothetical protein AB0O76_28945 [Streptomyces sp. NPDC086554]